MSARRPATTSSWVSAMTMSRPARSLNRASSGPISAYRPEVRQTSAGWTTGIDISWPPIRSCSSRMTCSTRWLTRKPSGRREYSPAPSWRT